MNVDSIGTKLAVLVLETEQAQEEVDRLRLEDARSDFTQALNDEVQALREQANAAFRGALFEGGATLVSGGLAVGGAALECDGEGLALASRTTGDLAGPLGAVVGHDYGGADAKRAQGAGQLASWEIEDLNHSLDQADRAQNEALEWAASLNESDAATTRAVLANLA
jgi:hypothetical protein